MFLRAFRRMSSNALSQEKSPYLLQHANNPVAWYPWGETAFEKAARERKMVFLSIGYASCHWCHVMEKESFENEEIAEILNTHFVSVKLDREEHPDVDRSYMLFVQATTGSGGWPLSVFLTPDFKPFFGGTYFPAVRRYGMPSFKEVLLSLVRMWSVEDERKDIQQKSSRIFHTLLEATPSTSGDLSHSLIDRILTTAYVRTNTAYDSIYGGFTAAPKFPRPTELHFLLSYARTYASNDTHSTNAKKALSMAVHTLHRMRMGGIYDHIGGGFHRYSVDELWHVPHFEKMLYDQAQLAVVYIDAYRHTGEEDFKTVAKQVLDYVQRNLSTTGLGAYFSSEDADSFPSESSSLKKEGAFYVWKHAELKELLHSQNEIFTQHFSVETESNATYSQRSDPHGEFVGENILAERLDLGEFCATHSAAVQHTANDFNVSVEDVEEVLEEAKKVLFAARNTRPRPALDDKIIGSWNGLLLSALARAIHTISDTYQSAAEGLAQFVYDNLYVAGSSESAVLYRIYRQGRSDIRGNVEDYAFLIEGLLDLFEATGRVRWLEWAYELQSLQNAKFWDEESGGYFCSEAADSSVILRLKSEEDGAEPAANSVSVLNLFRFRRLLPLDEKAEEWREMALETIHSMLPRVEESPKSFPKVLEVLCHLRGERRDVAVVLGEDKMSELLRSVHGVFDPSMVVTPVLPGSESEFLVEKSGNSPELTRMFSGGGAVVCKESACFPAVNTVQALVKLLE